MSDLVFLLSIVAPLFMASKIAGQGVLAVSNGGFEDTARVQLPPSGKFKHGTYQLSSRDMFDYQAPIDGWEHLSWQKGVRIFSAQWNTPDILPHPMGWKVEHEAIEGNTYLSLVVRNDGSYEVLGQYFESPLEEGKCYEVNVQLAYSRTFVSDKDPFESMREQAYRFEQAYDTPAVFQILGRNAEDDEVLLAETPPVDHEDWMGYDLFIYADQPYEYMVIRAYFDGDPDRWEPYYFGHILLDDLSDVFEVECGE